MFCLHIQPKKKKIYLKNVSGRIDPFLKKKKTLTHKNVYMLKHKLSYSCYVKRERKREEPAKFHLQGTDMLLCTTLALSNTVVRTLF